MATSVTPTPFVPFARESTRSRLYQSIRDAILNGTLHTGQRLLEVPIAKQFNVSRAVLREALQQLASEGLVEQNAYKGTRVVRLTPEQIDEIIAVRLILETEAARLAMLHLTAEGRRELRAHAAQMAKEPDVIRFGQLDLALHRRIWELSGNSALARSLEQLTVPLFAMSMLMRTNEQRRTPRSRLVRGDHTPLVEAICGGKPAVCAEAVRIHLTENWAAIKARFAEFLSHEAAQ
ncbi:MAG: GntR family transcriptional regulator [Acidobacteria bacterium]|nr:GntR family transcriptional regulator [Acidobacteriota bacterium]